MSMLKREQFHKNHKKMKFTYNELLKSYEIITSLLNANRITERELTALLVARDSIYAVLTDTYEKTEE